MFVMGYVSRPVIHVKPRSANQRSMWLCFSDALVRYGSGLKEADLGEAYRKAGVSFRGQLEQNFVVLHDKPVYQSNANLVQVANKSNETPKKRPREGTESGTPAKRIPTNGAKPMETWLNSKTQDKNTKPMETWLNCLTQKKKKILSSALGSVCILIEMNK